MGEKPDAFEPFHPDRIVGRILGMGDMMSLIEKAEDDARQKEERGVCAEGAERAMDFRWRIFAIS